MIWNCVPMCGSVKRKRDSDGSAPPSSRTARIPNKCGRMAWTLNKFGERGCVSAPRMVTRGAYARESSPISDFVELNTDAAIDTVFRGGRRGCADAGALAVGRKSRRRAGSRGTAGHETQVL